jgi:hypothetical protein
MKSIVLLSAFALSIALASAADAKKGGKKADAKAGGPPPVGYTDTPMLPGGKWHVHDPERPQPRVVTAGAAVGQPPSDAIVLFDGKDLSRWRNAKGEAAAWKVENGYVECVAKTGDILTKEEFGDVQLHIEFATPNPPSGDSQGRGNSGVFLMGKYEFQVLDSYNNRTYADGSAGSLYGQFPPLVNASRPSGEWQTYDIVFRAPRFKDGKLESPATVTAFHNGVLVQDNTAYIGPSTHKRILPYEPHAEKGPLRLQDHGNPMRFRNIWARPLRAEDRN